MRGKVNQKYDQNFTASLTLLTVALLKGSHSLLAYTCSCLWTQLSFQEKEVCLGFFFPRSEFVKLKYINSFLLARLEDIVLSIGFYIYYGAFRPNQSKFSPCVAHGSLFAGVNG